MDPVIVVAIIAFAGSVGSGALGTIVLTRQKRADASVTARDAQIDSALQAQGAALQRCEGECSELRAEVSRLRAELRTVTRDRDRLEDERDDLQRRLATYGG